MIPIGTTTLRRLCPRVDALRPSMISDETTTKWLSPKGFSRAKGRRECLRLVLRDAFFGHLWLRQAGFHASLLMAGKEIQSNPRVPAGACPVPLGSGHAPTFLSGHVPFRKNRYPLSGICASG